MKFIAEPVKYKQRYKWRTCTRDAELSGDWDLNYMYWDEMWIHAGARALGFVLVSVPEEGYFISDNGTEFPHSHDHGPYPDLPTCKSVAETYIALNYKPDFSRPFKRRKK